MVGSCGKTETDIAIFWKTDTETDTDFWKNRPKNQKPIPTYKTDTDPALVYTLIHSSSDNGADSIPSNMAPWVMCIEKGVRRESRAANNER